MWYQINHEKNMVTISVSIKSNAKKTEIIGVVNNALKINLHAQAVENKANIELVDFLKKTLALKKSDIQIVQGEKSKSKVIQLFFSENVKNFLQNHSE